MLIYVFSIGLFYPETNATPPSPPVWGFHVACPMAVTPHPSTESACGQQLMHQICGLWMTPFPGFSASAGLPGIICCCCFSWILLADSGGTRCPVLLRLPSCPPPTLISLSLSLSPPLTWVLTCEGRAQGWLIAQREAELALRNMYGIESTHLLGIAPPRLCCRLLSDLH